MLAGYRQEWCSRTAASRVRRIEWATAPPSSPASMCDHVEPRLSPWPSVLGILGHAAQTSAGRLAAETFTPVWGELGSGSVGRRGAAPSNRGHCRTTSGSNRSGSAREEELRSGTPWANCEFTIDAYLHPPSHRQGKVDGLQGQTDLHERTESSPARLDKWMEGSLTALRR
jgi:hypothetical protein